MEAKTTEIPSLTEEQWVECLERLTLYAARKFLRYGWGRSTKKNERAGPCGVSPPDLAAGAIVSVMEGTRNYNQVRYPDFMSFLRAIVDSQINHLANSVERRIMRRLPHKTNAEDEPPAIDPSGNEPDPAQSCLNRDLIERLKAILAQDFCNDEIVSGILECYEADITKDQEIADALGVDVKEVYNAKKRLRRKMKKVQQDFTLEGRR